MFGVLSRSPLIHITRHAFIFFSFRIVCPNDIERLSFCLYPLHKKNRKKKSVSFNYVCTDKSRIHNN